MNVPTFAIFAFINFSPCVIPACNAAFNVLLVAASLDGVLPGPIPILANLAKSPTSGGGRVCGLPTIAWLIASYTLTPAAGIIAGFGVLSLAFIAACNDCSDGDTGEVAFPWNTDSGTSFIWFWIACTLGKSDVPFTNILLEIQAILVGVFISCIPFGTIPFHVGPVIRKVPPVEPVARAPTYANTCPNVSMNCIT